MARHIVARTTDIPPGGNKVVDIDGRDIVVFHVNGEFFALLSARGSASCCAAPGTAGNSTSATANPGSIPTG
jgi:nitrite reductase/ring-hydroxylating ferredoxin subunit